MPRKKGVALKDIKEIPTVEAVIKNIRQVAQGNRMTATQIVTAQDLTLVPNEAEILTRLIENALRALVNQKKAHRVRYDDKGAVREEYAVRFTQEFLDG
jgi:hypothetical protein